MAAEQESPFEPLAEAVPASAVVDDHAAPEEVDHDDDRDFVDPTEVVVQNDDEVRNILRTAWELPMLAHFCNVFKGVLEMKGFKTKDLEESFVDGRGVGLVGKIHIAFMKVLDPKRGAVATEYNWPFKLRDYLRFNLLPLSVFPNQNPLLETQYRFLSVDSKISLMYEMFSRVFFDSTVAETLATVSEATVERARVLTFGKDADGYEYFYFYFDALRLYRSWVPQTDDLNQQLEDNIWQVAADGLAEWLALIASLSASDDVDDRDFAAKLEADYLPAVRKADAAAANRASRPISPLDFVIPPEEVRRTLRARPKAPEAEPVVTAAPTPSADGTTPAEPILDPVERALKEALAVDVATRHERRRTKDERAREAREEVERERREHQARLERKKAVQDHHRKMRMERRELGADITRSIRARRAEFKDDEAALNAAIAESIAASAAASAQPFVYEDAQSYVAAAVKFIDPYPRNADGTAVLPQKVGRHVVHALGVVETNRPGFHSERYIWPIGFKTAREYASTLHPDGKATYFSEIVDTGEAVPSFRVTADDNPALDVVKTSPTAAWGVVIEMANKLRPMGHKRATNSVSGPDCLGLVSPVIMHMIQCLPNADKCRSYDVRPIVIHGEVAAAAGAAAAAAASGAATAGAAPSGAAPMDLSMAPAPPPPKPAAKRSAGKAGLGAPRGRPPKKRARKELDDAAQLERDLKAQLLAEARAERAARGPAQDGDDDDGGDDGGDDDDDDEDYRP